MSALIPAMFMGSQITGNIMEARERERLRQAEIDRQRREARKAALQRAIGATFGPANFKEPLEADLTTPALLRGLGQIGTQMTAGR